MRHLLPLLLLGGAACGGVAFTTASDLLVDPADASPEASAFSGVRGGPRFPAGGAQADASEEDGAPAPDGPASGGQDGVSVEGGGEGQATDAPSETQAEAADEASRPEPSPEAAPPLEAGPPDAWACTPMPPVTVPTDRCGGQPATTEIPTYFLLPGTGPVQCGQAHTPAACMCKETWGCACLVAANPCAQIAGGAFATTCAPGSGGALYVSCERAD